MTQKASNAEKPEVQQKVVVQLWMEAEKGWGTRPDGYSLHKDETARAAYVKATWGSRPKDDVPDEYSFPSGMYEGEVDDETYTTVFASGRTTGRRKSASPQVTSRRPDVTKGSAVLPPEPFL